MKLIYAGLCIVVLVLVYAVVQSLDEKAKQRDNARQQKATANLRHQLRKKAAARQWQALDAESRRMTSFDLIVTSK